MNRPVVENAMNQTQNQILRYTISINTLYDKCETYAIRLENVVSSVLSKLDK